MRAAIVGLGAIAPVHARAISRAGGSIAALCDVDGARAESFRAKHAPDAAVYADFSDMLAAGGFDVVHICTPHYLHAAESVAALEAGYHVLCEKPMCLNAEECGRVISCARRAKGIFGVCHQNRWNEGAARMRAALAGNAPFSGFGSVVWRRDAAYYRSGDWRGRRSTEGGGALINQALHTLDLLIFFMGMPDRVLARVSNDRHKGVIEVEDTAECLFSGEGFCFHFFATTAAEADFPPSVTVAARGVTVGFSGGVYWENGRGEAVRSGVSELGKEVWGDGHAKLIADFYAAAEGGAPFPVGAEEGAKVVRAIEAAYRSEGREISIREIKI